MILARENTTFARLVAPERHWKGRKLPQTPETTLHSKLFNPIL